MFSHWEPDVGVPANTMAPFQHLAYTVALRHGETLSWSSNDEGWGGRIDIKNTTSFPFLTRSWERPWVAQTDGTYGATFAAPYTGLFVVELHSNETREGGTHLRWSVVDDASKLARPGVPPPPPIVSAAGEAIAPSPLPERAKSLAEQLKNAGVMSQSEGTVALALLDETVFASGDADGVIKVWDARRGMELYQLAKLPGAITALAASADGLTLTATFARGARSFTVQNAAVWSQHG